MGKKRTSLVLEGGGMRGAYTAGALSWLIDQGIEFDNAYGISTGAVHLANYLMGSKEDLFTFSVDGITDKRIIGVKAFFHSGHIVDYEMLFQHILPEEYHFVLTPLKDCRTHACIGLYDLNQGKTGYVPIREVGNWEMQAATTLPILGKAVEKDGKQILDGGITDMIPIQAALDDGCERFLIITTKAAGYVRKPAKKMIVRLMALVYPQCPQIAKDYAIRHLDYQKQISLIRELQEAGKAAYIYPSKTTKVTRLGGKREDLVNLYELGYSDMEARKEEILALFQ
mgnify:CR=1 FL=1